KRRRSWRIGAIRASGYCWGFVNVCMGTLEVYNTDASMFALVQLKCTTHMRRKRGAGLRPATPAVEPACLGHSPTTASKAIWRSPFADLRVRLPIRSRTVTPSVEIVSVAGAEAFCGDTS